MKKCNGCDKLMEKNKKYCCHRCYLVNQGKKSRPPLPQPVNTELHREVEHLRQELKFHKRGLWIGIRILVMLTILAHLGIWKFLKW